MKNQLLKRIRQNCEESDDTVLSAAMRPPSYPRAFVSLFSLMIFTSLFFSCAAGLSSVYDFDYPLTKEIARAKSSSIKVTIPLGWFAAEENENNLIDLWLIKDDYSATLNFIPMNLDSAATRDIEADEIKELLKLSQSFKKAGKKTIQKFMNQEIFELNGKIIGAYEYLSDSGMLVRVAVFKTGKKYYESSAVPARAGNNPELYKVQNSVLSSID